MAEEATTQATALPVRVDNAPNPSEIVEQPEAKVEAVSNGVKPQGSEPQKGAHVATEPIAPIEPAAEGMLDNLTLPFALYHLTD